MKKPSIWSEPKRLDEPTHHKRNVVAELEAPIEAYGIVYRNGATMPGTTPRPRAKVVYGKPAAPRADLELEAT